MTLYCSTLSLPAPAGKGTRTSRLQGVRALLPSHSVTANRLTRDRTGVLVSRTPWIMGLNNFSGRWPVGKEGPSVCKSSGDSFGQQVVGNTGSPHCLPTTTKVALSTLTLPFDRSHSSLSNFSILFNNFTLECYR